MPETLLFFLTDELSDFLCVLNLQEMLVFIGFSMADEKPRIYSTIEAIVTAPLTSQITSLLWLIMAAVIKDERSDLSVNRNKDGRLICN